MSPVSPTRTRKDPPRRRIRALGPAGLLALSSVLAPLASARDEVPFITTPDHVTLAMLQLADVGPQDQVLDLGSGDGRIVITAARRFGARGLGVEIVPELVAKSLAHARQAGVQDRVDFRVQDLFLTDLSAASVITMYLLPEINLQLRPRLLALKPGTRIVSHDWDLGEWTPDRTVVIDAPDKPIGREKKSTLHLWRVPAPVQGRWCAVADSLATAAVPAAAASRPATLSIDQRFQRFSATLSAPGQPAPVLVWDGRLDGTRLFSADSGGASQTSLQWEEGGGQPSLRVVQIDRLALGYERARFTRCAP